MLPATAEEPVPTAVSLVLAVHGPTLRSREALDRARQLVSADAIRVYPAIRAGIDAAEALDVDGCTSVGSRGLAEVLAQLPDGPVLLLHDDVLLTPASFARLVRAWERTGGAVAPQSNDPETDHFVGPLPLVADARSTLSRHSGARRTTPAVRVRPSCVLADRALLLALDDQHLAYPLTTLHLADGLGHVAAGAVAAHDGACAHRVPDADALGAGPLLVAGLIVRDEEDVLADCLASLDGLVDRVVVCDTGSVDDTVAIARAAGATVIEREWRDDFAWARNEVLAEIGDAHFVLSIDADEVVTADVETVRRLLALAIDEHDVLTVRTDSEDTGGATLSSSAWLWRIFRPDRARFDGALHEQLVPIGDPATRTTALTVGELTGITLTHRGYTAERVAAKDKVERNTSIARAAYEADPSLQHTLNYARSLAMDGREPGLRRELLERADREAVSASEVQRGFIKQALARCLLELGELDAAVDHARESTRLVPRDPTATLVLSEALASSGDPAAALAAIAACAAAREDEAGPRPIVEDGGSVLGLLSVRAHLAALTGDVAAAVEAMATFVATAPGVTADWAEPVRLLLRSWPDEATEVLTGLCAADESGAISSAIANVASPGTAAEVVVLAHERGASSAGQLEFAFVAAMVGQRWDVFDRLLPYREILQPAQRDAIADRLAERGEVDAGRRLREPVLTSAAR